MGTVVVTEFVTLDGVMEAPGGEPGHPHSGWVFDFIGNEQAEYKFDEVVAAEVHLIGRRTYESFAEAWPEREGPFADRMNSMPKYVVSSTLTDPEWENTTVIGTDFAAEVTRLKDEIDGEILVAGSRTLVHALTELDVVDEYRLMVFPVILGSGFKVFPEALEKRPLELTDTVAFETGVQVSTYRRVRSG